MAYTTIDDPSKHFQIKLYTGNGSTQSITFDGNSDMQPDWLWTKVRSETGSHRLTDNTRGLNKPLFANGTDVEGTEDNYASFDSDGFSLKNNSVNENNRTYVAWCWKANGGTTTSVSASGAVNASTHQANTTGGLSIITYTGEDNIGDTVTHGLGAVPGFIIIKDRDNSSNWAVYHHKNTSAPETDYLFLNNNNATADAANYFSDTAPTSTVFTVGQNGDTGDADAYVAYCFTEIQGYSKFGSYTGNGNADGTFNYTGFKPAWLMIKRTSNAENWFIVDNRRETSNPRGVKFIYANTNDAEVSSDKHLDLLSNGFKLRDVTGFHNDNGETYIYVAFAESPIVTSTGVPTTAE